MSGREKFHIVTRRPLEDSLHTAYVVAGAAARVVAPEVLEVASGRHLDVCTKSSKGSGIAVTSFKGLTVERS